MPATDTDRPRNVLLIARELRLSLRNNTGAYSYSIMITCALAVLSSIGGPPTAAQVFLFLAGAAVGVGAVETIATRGFRRSLATREPTKVVALGSSLSLVSISVAVGVAALCGVLLPATLSWPAGSCLGSLTYLLVSALEMAAARRIEEARNLE